MLIRTLIMALLAALSSSACMAAINQSADDLQASRRQLLSQQEQTDVANFFYNLNLGDLVLVIGSFFNALDNSDVGTHLAVVWFNGTDTQPSQWFDDQSYLSQTLGLQVPDYRQTIKDSQHCIIQPPCVYCITKYEYILKEGFTNLFFIVARISEEAQNVDAAAGQSTFVFDKNETLRRRNLQDALDYSENAGSAIASVDNCVVDYISQAFNYNQQTQRRQLWGPKIPSVPDIPNIIDEGETIIDEGQNIIDQVPVDQVINELVDIVSNIPLDQFIGEVFKIYESCDLKLLVQLRNIHVDFSQLLFTATLKSISLLLDQEYTVALTSTQLAEFQLRYNYMKQYLSSGNVIGVGHQLGVISRLLLTGQSTTTFVSFSERFGSNNAKQLKVDEPKISSGNIESFKHYLQALQSSANPNKQLNETDYACLNEMEDISTILHNQLGKISSAYLNDTAPSITKACQEHLPELDQIITSFAHTHCGQSIVDNDTLNMLETSQDFFKNGEVVVQHQSFGRPLVFVNKVEVSDYLQQKGSQYVALSQVSSAQEEDSDASSNQLKSDASSTILDPQSQQWFEAGQEHGLFLRFIQLKATDIEQDAETAGSDHRASIQIALAVLGSLLAVLCVGFTSYCVNERRKLAKRSEKKSFVQIRVPQDETSNDL